MDKLKRPTQIEVVVSRNKLFDDFARVFNGSPGEVLANVEKALKEAEDKLPSGHSVKMKSEFHGYDGAFDVIAVVSRPESAEEFAARLQEYEKKKQRIEDTEKAELARLEKKYKRKP